ncbi:uncharacterized protein B0P05DRAFT_270639 [Gilbertella persicaria]|uniref:uncharacterized protein n=1 Tax=Gilbertella persicaria TaxID=101096 RepID=UPI00221E3F45|nr:uncharacterized protein B0P05DRAFT_270639 [Gilbertella persicaria]KAI8059999.1 hypothetical protein B0P05DRAFT_270639 [Gilbertella persicaria]
MTLHFENCQNPMPVFFLLTLKFLKKIQELKAGALRHFNFPPQLHSLLRYTITITITIINITLISLLSFFFSWETYTLQIIKKTKLYSLLLFIHILTKIKLSIIYLFYWLQNISEHICLLFPLLSSHTDFITISVLSKQKHSRQNV